MRRLMMVMLMVVSAVVPLTVTGVMPAGAVGGTPNLLVNAGFENQSQGWGPGNGSSGFNFTTYTGSAYEGTRFMAASTSRPGASLAQTVNVAPVPGRSYSLAVWARSTSGTRTGTLTLWGLGGAQESSGTRFTLGAGWQQVSVTLAPRSSGHTALKAEIYLDTTGPDYNFDAAQLLDMPLVNAGFENQSEGWGPGNGSSGFNFTTYSGSAREGSRFMAASTSRPGASLAQNVDLAPVPGRTYRFSVWIRSTSGTRTGRVTLWGLGGAQESATTAFSVGSSWRPVTVSFSPTRTGHSVLKAELYLDTTGPDYDFDGARLTTDDPNGGSTGPDGGTRVPASQRHTSPAAWPFIQSYEGGPYLTPYNDPAGNCTVGWGHLLHTGRCSGSERQRTYSRADVESMFASDVVAHENRLKRAIGTTPLKQQEFDALVDFVFNLGTVCGPHFTTICSDLTAVPAHYTEIPGDLALYVKAGSTTLPGLVARRADEAAMWSHGDYARG